MFRSRTAQSRSSFCRAGIAALLLTVAVNAQALSHLPDRVFRDGLEGVSAGPFNDADAARFLNQATFGATDADIAHLRSIGYQAWLTEQFAAPTTLEMDYIHWTDTTLGEREDEDHRMEAWWLGALGGHDPHNPPQFSGDVSHDHTDQLRQRVAFALSEIFVVSDQNATLAGFKNDLAYYYDILAKDAFGNYRTLLEDVTLSPEMGVYLNMQGNRRADLDQNIHPDENFAREVNQLFSIGLVMLDSGGRPIVPTTPTYTQSTVSAFAHVFTGWNFIDCTAGNFTDCGPESATGQIDDYNFEHPMVPFASFHDNGSDTHNDLVSKQLLAYSGAASGGLLGAGGTPQADLKFALDNIFNHPNVPAFISKQLIQHLVTSNPSAAYVTRVGAVFGNDGTGVRGNLKAVVKAILLDPEARIGQYQNPTTYGKLREPLLVLTHLWRAMGGQHLCGHDLDTPGDPGNPDIISKYLDQPYRYAGYNGAWYPRGWIDQMPLNADTVFNFFKPGYVPSGEMTAAGLLGPEFQITTDATVADTSNDTFYRTFYADVSDTCDADDDYGYMVINHAQDVALAGTSISSPGGTSDPGDRLVDAYNIRFMGGQMSPFMRAALIANMNTVTRAGKYDSDPDWRVARVRRALALILTSPEYLIQK